MAEGDGKRRRMVGVKNALLDLNIQLSSFNRRVGTAVELNDVDYDCLALLVRFGPLSPTTLASRAGLHPATMTGVLDRLERGRWVRRERDPDARDRRAVVVRALRERGAELFGVLAGMNQAMDGILAEYTPDQLELIAGFIRRTADAGAQAAAELASISSG